MDIHAQNRTFSFMTGSSPLVALDCVPSSLHSLTHGQRTGQVTP
jgi:hypothetical protein